MGKKTCGYRGSKVMNSTSKEAYTGRVAYERVNEFKEARRGYKSGELALV
jgi:hypothetical protein